MKHLLMATSVLEAGAGVVLLGGPSTAVALLLGSPLEAPAALTVARIGGAGLLALGVACWVTRGDAQSRAARGVVAAMVIYNLGTVVVLGAAGIWSRPVGVALWPAVVLHAAMTTWCLTCLMAKPAQDLK